MFVHVEEQFHTLCDKNIYSLHELTVRAPEPVWGRSGQEKIENDPQTHSYWK